MVDHKICFKKAHFQPVVTYSKGQMIFSKREFILKIIFFKATSTITSRIYIRKINFSVSVMFIIPDFHSILKSNDILNIRKYYNPLQGINLLGIAISNLNYLNYFMSR